MKAGIVVSEFYPKIAEGMLASCMLVLEDSPKKVSDIKVIRVPGAFDIPFALRVLVSQSSPPVLAVALGCVIRGETYHFNIVSDICAHGIMDVQLHSGIPIGNGVLTVENEKQALARVDKGGEAARAALALASIVDEYGHTKPW